MATDPMKPHMISMISLALGAALAKTAERTPGTTLEAGIKPHAPVIDKPVKFQTKNQAKRARRAARKT